MSLFSVNELDLALSWCCRKLVGNSAPAFSPVMGKGLEVVAAALELLTACWLTRDHGSFQFGGAIGVITAEIQGCLPQAQPNIYL